MKIKEYKSKKQFLKFFIYLKNHPKIKTILYIVLIFIVLIIVSLSSIYYGMYLHKTGIHVNLKNSVLNIIKDRASIFPNYIKSFSAKPEKIFIDIKQEDYQKLAFKREEAMRVGNLFSDSDDYVPAIIRHNGEKVKVKLRLKGGGGDHWMDEKRWSFRIEVKGEKTLFGMKQFSIQLPRTRGYLNEWVFHKILDYQGLMNLRYDYLDVTVNGKHFGIYAREENFRKNMIENNGYREGVIVRFDDHLRLHKDPSIGINEVYSSGAIDAYGEKRISENEALSKQFNQAKNLLTSFRNNSLPTSKVFDNKKLAKFFAVIDLMGYHHALSYSNIRFYYNPITSLLEPIGYDNSNIYQTKNITQDYHHNENSEYSLLNNRQVNFHESFFRDELFFKEYIQALDDISQREWLDDFFEKNNTELNKRLSIIHKSFPWYNFNNKPILYKNQEYIRNILKPLQGLQAYFLEEGDGVARIEIGNIQSLPLFVDSLTYGDGIVFEPKKNEIIYPKKYLEPVDFLVKEFSVPHNFTWDKSVSKNLIIKYHILGMDDVLSEEVKPWTFLDKDFINSDFMRQNSNLDEFGFVEVDDIVKEIMFLSGEHSLDKNMIIPSGYVVKCTEGTVIDLKKQAKMLSYSPIKFIGSEENPIIIKSDDSSGQGIVVLNGDRKSILSYVYFENLSAPSEGNWSLTGAVNFYESPVEIVNSKFSKNRNSDDFLNIIRSDFYVANTLFENTFADAVDTDFSKGKIENSYFVNIGLTDSNGDALDFSGSKIQLSDIRIDNFGDKGVSAGENSEITMNNIVISNGSIGIASKDLSSVNGSKININNTKIGFAAYRKKSEFGGGDINLKLAEVNNVEHYSILDSESLVNVNGRKEEVSSSDELKIIK